jgi:hypothetical protein
VSDIRPVVFVCPVCGRRWSMTYIKGSSWTNTTPEHSRWLRDPEGQRKAGRCDGSGRLAGLEFP